MLSHTVIVIRPYSYMNEFGYVFHQSQFEYQYNNCIHKQFKDIVWYFDDKCVCLSSAYWLYHNNESRMNVKDATFRYLISFECGQFIVSCAKCRICISIVGQNNLSNHKREHSFLHSLHWVTHWETEIDTVRTITIKIENHLWLCCRMVCCYYSCCSQSVFRWNSSEFHVIIWGKVVADNMVYKSSNDTWPVFFCGSGAQ